MASSQCSVLVKKHDGQLVHVSPHKNKWGRWKLDALTVVDFLPDGFPSEVTLAQCGHLEVLMIRTKGIRTIPEYIKHLQNITELWLMNGDLEEFPLAVCQLNKLTYLDLSFNKINKIPAGACAQMNTLTTLKMPGCGLTCLPEDFHQMGNLEELKLLHNKLSHLCDGFKNMTKLRVVRLFYNSFDCIEDEFLFDTLVNIETLALSGTNMKSLPGGIGQMVKLKWIQLSDNKLEYSMNED
jgi:Leucine-rich repeat (LRR) protein